MFLTAVQPALVSGRCVARHSFRAYRSNLKFSPSAHSRRSSHASVATDIEDTQPCLTPESGHYEAPLTIVSQDSDESKYKFAIRGGRHRRANLGFTTLGKPSEIIIIDEDYKRNSRIGDEPVAPEDRSSPSESLEDVIEELDSGLTKREDVNANIEGVRAAVAKVDSTVSAEQLSNIYSSLLGGFSAAQLKRYALTVVEVQRLHVNDQFTNITIDENSRPDSVPSISWNGPKLPLGEHFTLSKKKFKAVLSRKPGKQKIASAIVEHLWRLRTADQPRSISIEIDPIKGRLLSSGLNRELASICQEQKVNVDIPKGRRTVRLSGIAENVEPVKHKVERLIESIAVRSFQTYKSSLSKFNANPDSPDQVISNYEGSPVIKQIERKYNVAICAVSSTQRTCRWKIISYGADDNHVNNALRELYLSHKPVRLGRPAIWSAEGVKNLRQVPTIPDDGNPLSPPQMEWVRWCGLPALPDRGKLSKHLTKTAPILQSLVRESSVMTEIQKSAHEQTRSIRFQLEIGLGQTLVKGSAKGEKPDHTAPLSLPNLTISPISFMREFPRLPNLLRGAHGQQVRKYVKIELVPVVPQSNAPTITLLYWATAKDHLRRPRLLKAEALLREHFYDLLLPHTPVDLHLHGRILYDLVSGSPDYVSDLTNLLFDKRKSFKELNSLFQLPLPLAVQNMNKVARTIRKGKVQSAKRRLTQVVENPPTEEDLSKPLDYTWSSSVLMEDVQLNHNGLPLIFSQSTNLETGSKWKELKLVMGNDANHLADDSTAAHRHPGLSKREAALQLIRDAKKFAEELGQF